MKLEEIIEANMYSVDHAEPSGAGSAVTVDPDEADDMLDPKGNRYTKIDDVNKNDRSKMLRRRVKSAKSEKAPPKDRAQVVGDNSDLSDAGANSAMNGPYK